MFFKKKEKPSVGYWYLIDFSDAAKEYGVANNFCKKIITMYDDYQVKEEDYSEARVKIMKRNGDIVVDATSGLKVPRESVAIPRTDIAFGTIQLFKRIH